jgi:hypothetical protein
VFQNPGGDVTACLASVHLTTGAGDLVNTQFLSQELSALGRFESGGHFVEWCLYGVDALFLQ